MNVMHYGGETLGLKSPICGRVPNWASMTTAWESVTCKRCLKKRQQPSPGKTESQK